MVAITAASAALYASLATAAVSAVSAIAQGKAASDAADYNSQVANRNATIVQQQAAAQAGQQQRASRLKIGAMEAGYGAAGVTPDGSPLDVLASSAASAELDKQNLLYNGRLKAIGYGDTATLSGMQGDSAASRGYASAATALLGGAAQAYSKYSGGAGTAISTNDAPAVGTGAGAFS